MTVCWGSVCSWMNRSCCWCSPWPRGWWRGGAACRQKGRPSNVCSALIPFWKMKCKCVVISLWKPGYNKNKYPILLSSTSNSNNKSENCMPFKNMFMLNYTKYILPVFFYNVGQVLHFNLQCNWFLCGQKTCQVRRGLLLCICSLCAHRRLEFSAEAIQIA